MAMRSTRLLCFARILKRFPASNGFHLSLVVPYNVGTRISETFAIDLNENVDFERHELHIKGQLVKIEKIWFIKPPNMILTVL